MTERRFSLFELAIENHVRNYMATDEFKTFLAHRLKWAVQGYEKGFGGDEREAFTETVAKRIRRKARSHRVVVFGFRLWRARYSWDWCRERAEQMVTDFLRDEKIKFGDPLFYWGDGKEIADRFGTTVAIVAALKNRKAWRHLERTK